MSQTPDTSTPRRADGLPDFDTLLDQIAAIGPDERALLKAAADRIRTEAAQNLRAAEARLQHLQGITARFADAETTDEVRRVILSDALTALGTDGGGLRLVTAHGLVLDEHELGPRTRGETIRQLSALPLLSNHPAAQAARTGEAVFNRDAHETIRRYPELAARVRRDSVQANAHLPLKRGEEVFAVLSVSFAEPRAWGESERGFALAIAGRSAVAYERARLHEAEQRRTLHRERDVKRLERLLAFTDRLNSLSDPADMARVLVDERFDIYGPVAGGVALVRADGRLVHVALHGYPPEIAAEMLGSVIPEDSPAADALRTGRPLWIDSRDELLRRYPGLRPLQERLPFGAFVALPLHGGGRVPGVLGFRYPAGVVPDAEERHFASLLAERLASALERAQILADSQTLYAQEQAARAQAEEASRLKDDFLATVSHELRTPLTAFLGYAQLLQARPRDEAYLARTLEKMVRAARDQAQLIEDLLDVSRIVSGKLRLDPQPIDLAPVVYAALDTIRPAIEARGLRLDVDVCPETSALVGDANRLQQVVWNLLSNAAKFTPAGGSVAVRLEQSGRELVLTVRDTGRGIGADFLPYVFDRFRQADSTSQRTSGGLGLGLAIVRHLVELHGGSVEAASAGEDQGATFTVRLPLTPRAGPPHQPLGAQLQPPEEPQELRGLRVLVVDDQPDILDMLHDVLAGAGAEVRRCTGAREALAELRGWRPDVLVSDIAMPDEDGYWLIQSARALSPEEGGQVPAVALTAYVRIEDRMRVLAAGYQLYVPKPVDPQDLLAVVARLARAAD